MLKAKIILSDLCVDFCENPEVVSEVSKRPSQGLALVFPMQSSHDPFLKVRDRHDMYLQLLKYDEIMRLETAAEGNQ